MKRLVILFCLLLCLIPSAASARSRHRYRRSGGQATTPAPTPATGGNHVVDKVTFYGWPDNSPPGPAIAYPVIHSQADGTGSYADPITFATATGLFPKG